MSELLRRPAEQKSESSAAPSRRLKTTLRRVLVKASTGKVLAPEMVKEASEDDLV